MSEKATRSDGVQDQAASQKQFHQAVGQGLRDVEAGRVIDDDEMTAILNREFGDLSKT